jgi:hypothetical protein
MVNQTQVMETLSYLLGENSVPTSGIAVSRRNFIQRTLEEVYRAYPWPFAQANATLAIVDGNATLPADFDYQHKIYGYFYAGDTQTGLEEINIGDSDLYVQNQNKFWVEHISNGTYKIVTKDNDYSSVLISYQIVPPVINASIYTPFNDSGALALGARRYVKLGENPDADISQDEALFQKRLGESISATQVNRPIKKNRKVYYANNYRLGEG